MCKPHRCPHIAVTGNVCVYCPGGPDSDFEYSTQSYTGYEVNIVSSLIFKANFYACYTRSISPLPSDTTSHRTGKSGTCLHQTSYNNWDIPVIKLNSLSWEVLLCVFRRIIEIIL